MDTVCVWPQGAEDELARYAVPSNRYRLVNFTGDGQFLVTGGMNGVLQVVDVARNEMTGLSLPLGCVVGQLLSPPGANWILAMSPHGRARRWALPSGDLTADIEFDRTTSRAGILPDGERMVVGGPDHRARVLEIVTGRELLRFKTAMTGMSPITVTPNGSKALIATGKNMRAFNTNTGAASPLFRKAHSGAVSRIVIDPGDTWVATCAMKNAHVFELETREEVCRIARHGHFVSSVAISADGRWLATSAHDDKVRLFDFRQLSGQTD